MICDNIQIKNNELYFANQNVVELAKKYSTPLYLMDEDKIREKCRIYRETMKECFGDNQIVLYASKANSFKYLYKIINEEGLGIDCVSIGEIYTAKQSGFDLSKAYFHGNNKTDNDISYAIENNIGYFVADNIEEINAIDREAKNKSIKQKILIRVTPGIDTHTYEAISTGKVDSKFGTAIETGQADEIICETLKKENIILEGLHCHVGSQVFEEDVFERSAVIMLDYIKHLKDKYNLTINQLDLGGGYGVRYVEEDPQINISNKIKSVSKVIFDKCNELNISVPKIILEPGRSIVADAGMVLYTVGTLKKINGYKNYVSVDGGMADSPRFALYGAKYTAFVANKMNEKADFPVSIVGRCCESGDILTENTLVPSSIGRNDIIALLTTGAYHYSMASRYNKLPIPATVMLKNGNENFIVVKSETLEDLIKNDV